MAPQYLNPALLGTVPTMNLDVPCDHQLTNHTLPFMSLSKRKVKRDKYNIAKVIVQINVAHFMAHSVG